MVAWMIQVLGDWGLPGIFFLMVLENVFPPIPSEVIMALAGFNVAQGRMTFVGVVVAGILGTLVGNAAWYEVARAIGVERVRPLIDRYGKWFAISPEDFRQAEHVLAKYGPFAICLWPPPERASLSATRTTTRASRRRHRLRPEPSSAESWSGRCNLVVHVVA